jgi:Mg2+ and Co2+ transporter CorA
MPDNIIQRIIKLILDRDAAEKTKSDNQNVVDAIEGSWKKAAERIAEFLGVAFLVEKMKEFATSAIEHATEVDLSWRQLKGTIDATGESFDGMSEKLHASAEAFQSATIHKDEEYATSLTRLITLTGDVSASTNNMGLVANVAAQFFRGELEPATNLVAKAMNGNVALLQRMGIHARDAQEALEILAKRSMGSATREAESFGGQMKQLHNSFIEVLEDFGDAIIGSNGASSAMGSLRAAVAQLGDWVKRNQDDIRSWVTNGVAFAIDSLDVFIRAILLTKSTLLSLTETILGIVIGSYAELAIAYANAKDAAIAFVGVLGINKNEDLAGTQKIRAQAEALKAWAKAARDAGDASAESAEKILKNPLFSSDQFKAPPKPTELEVNAPEVGKNLSDKNTKAVEKAIEEFEKATKSAENMKKVLGDSFDSVGEEIKRTTKLVDVLAGEGLSVTVTKFGDLNARLHTLVTEVKPVQDVMKALAKTLDTELNIGFASAETGIDGAVTQLQVLEKMQKSVQSSMDELLKKGVSPTSAAYIDLKEQYQAYTHAIEDLKPIQAVIDQTKNLAKALENELSKGAMDGTSSLDILKKEQALVGAAMDDLRKNKVDPTSDAFLKFQKQFDDFGKAIRQQTGIKTLADELSALGDTLRKDLSVAALQGASALDKLKIEQQDLEKTILKLTADPLTRESKELKELEARYKGVTAAVKEQTTALQAQTVAADFLAEALGTALKGGLHDAAAAKAKENAIQAAEMLVRAGFFALFGNFPAATAAAGLAAQFGAVALAWEGLALSSGGGSSGGAPSVPAAPATPSSSGGSTITSARSASSASTSGSSTIPADVSIYLVGPGFDAVNPAVQRVVWGAQQEATERYGAGTRIRIRTTEGS